MGIQIRESSLNLVHIDFLKAKKNRSDFFLEVMQYVNTFCQSTDLDSFGYKQAKEYFETLYIPLCRLFIMTYEELEIGQRKMLSSYRAQFSYNQLIEDELRATSKELGYIIYDLEVFSKFDDFIHYVPTLNYLWYTKDMIDNKVEQLLQFDYDSPRFFDTAQNYIDLIPLGLSYIGNASINTSFSVPLGATVWTNTVNQAWDNFKLKWRQQIAAEKVISAMVDSVKDYLVNEKGIDETKLNQIIDMLQGNEVLKAQFIDILDYLFKGGLDFDSKVFQSKVDNVIQYVDSLLKASGLEIPVSFIASLVSSLIRIDPSVAYDLLEKGNNMTGGEISDIFGFMQIPGSNYFTTKEGSFQSKAGFMDGYDKIGPLLGMNLNTTVITFQSGDKEYRIQLWEGTYMHGMAIGGEIGIYSRPLEEALLDPYVHGQSDFILYECVEEGEQLRTNWEIFDNDGRRIVDNDTSIYATNGDHFWNAIFKMKKENELSINKDDIYTVSTYYIEDETFMQDFTNELEKMNMEYTKVATGNGYEVEVTWGK